MGAGSTGLERPKPAIGSVAADGPFAGGRRRVGPHSATGVRASEGGLAVAPLAPSTPDTFDERVRP
ncbi:hypothetical protein [Methylobacterium sp. J-076]|uniref:hypothetical protein n=1 Tax=Methylobacterium sp. J-076 TaxID=2836655 RepID=UPI001FBC0346|nr:hypothetical protein [Methylobacterium sp. J-076]MCJ2014407.1 hypothetical protein [Methylobacterium sp. J-076]